MKLTDVDGHKRFVLGPVEIAFVAALPTVLGFLLVQNILSGAATIQEQGKALTALVTQVGIMQEQLRVLNLQLANVPGLSDRMTRAESQIDRNKADIDDLRRMRGLK